MDKKRATKGKVLLMALILLVVAIVPTVAESNLYLILGIFVIPSDPMSQLEWGGVGIFWSAVGGLTAPTAGAIIAVGAAVSA